MREPFQNSSFDQNLGVPGVVYVLGNHGLREGWLKIGCSRHSGASRTARLNRDATTGTPGEYHCLYEQRALDCGTAERLVFAALRDARRGKWGQEFFEVSLDVAMAAIDAACIQVDALATAEVVREMPQSDAIRVRPRGRDERDAPASFALKAIAAGAFALAMLAIARIVLPTPPSLPAGSMPASHPSRPAPSITPSRPPLETRRETGRWIWKCEAGDRRVLYTDSDCPAGMTAIGVRRIMERKG